MRRRSGLAVARGHPQHASGVAANTFAWRKQACREAALRSPFSVFVGGLPMGAGIVVLNPDPPARRMARGGLEPLTPRFAIA